MSDSDERPAWLVPVSEMEPPSEEWLAQVQRTLTPAEHEELLRRINAPGGAHVSLDIAERKHIHRQLPVRDAGAVARVRAYLAEEKPNAFAEGIAAALAYAYGQAPTGPVSGEHPENAPPVCGDLYSEEAIALRVLQRNLVKNDHPVRTDPDYCVGVEHTLMWLQCRTDDPPLGPTTGQA